VTDHHDPMCRRFDDHLEDFALGQLDEPARSRLAAHAAGCPECRQLLDDLGAVVDRLVQAAPEVEPPVGFESRVLARIPVDVRAVRRRRWSVATVGGVAAALVSAIAMIAVFAPDRERAGSPITTPAGVAIGAVQIVSEPVDHLLVTIDAPQGTSGTRHCELRRPDGTWVEVGTWELADIEAGVWAVGIDPALESATAMRVVTDDGVVVATADLS
jgi:hypothetical protein